MKPFVYVAGPITSDPVTHTRMAVELYVQMLKDGKVIPFCPHLSVLAEYIAGRSDYELWLEHDFDMIGRCDALLRLEGESSGADREVEHARSLDIPVFMNQQGLYEWASWQTDPRPAGMRRLEGCGTVRRLYSVDT
jgi:hypothetical protein